MSEKPPEWAADLLKGQARQEETLNGFGRSIKEQGDTLNGLRNDVTRIDTNIDNMKERATEDRAEDRQTRTELEAKVGIVHSRVNDHDQEIGKLQNHVEDDHATLAATTAAEFARHDVDNNRHGGAAPGGGAVKTGATVAGGVTLGGGIIWGIVEIAKVFSG